MFYRLPTLSWSDTLDENKLPSIGNGHLATTVLTPSIYIDGLYNGRAGKSFLLDLLISYLVQYIDSNIQYSLLGASHRARIQAIFAADFDIDGCSAEQMDRTYRMETSRGWILDLEIYVGVQSWKAAHLPTLEIQVEQGGNCTSRV